MGAIKRVSALTGVLRTGRGMDYVIAGLVSLVVLIVYIPMLPPTVTCEDSGELITAAYRLGIPHPPGYPLWCLIAKAFTFIPHGTIAWRVALVSAVFGAATVFVLCLIILKLSNSRLAAITGSLALAFSGEFWEQSLIPEVYTLNTFQIILCIWLLLLWQERRKDMLLYAFAVVYGTGLCNHHTMLLLGPVFVLFVITVDPYFWQRWPVYATCTILALMMLSVYLYLPLRARTNPPVNWGNPQTWSDFWDVVTRKQYSFAAVENPRNLHVLLQQFWVFSKVYIWQFTPWLAWLPFLGLIALWRKNKRALLLMGAIALFISVGLILIINFKIDHQSVWVNSVFWIPAFMMGAIGLGLGIGIIHGGTASSLPRKFVAYVLAMASVASPFIVYYAANNKSDYYYAYDFGMNILKTLPEKAIYMPTADHATFPVMYLQAVEGLRPDVTIGNKYGYPEESLHKDMPFEIRSTFHKIPSNQEQELIEHWLIEHKDRPVYFTKHKILDGLPGYTLMNTGLIYGVLRPGEQPPERDFWKEYTWHTTDTNSTHDELTANYVLSDYYFFRGRDALAQHKPEEGMADFSVALQLGWETKETLNNLGSACAEYGILDQAIQYFSRTLELDPSYDTALRNLGKVYLQADQPDKALLQFEALVKKKKNDIEAVRLSAECLAKIGWADDAIARYEYLRSLTPNDPGVFRQLGYLYRDKKKEPEKAREYFLKSLSLNPNQPDIEAMVSGYQNESEKAEPKDDLPLPQLPQMPNIPNVPMPPMPEIPQPPQPGIQ